MSETATTPVTGTVRKRGRPPKANGADGVKASSDKPKRTRRTKAQIEAAKVWHPMTADKVIALDAAGKASVSIASGDAATDFAAATIVQLIGKEPWVRTRAAQIICAVCGELLKVA